MTPAQRLATFAASLSIEDIPDAVVDAAKLHLLDTLGTGLAAHALEVARYARDAALETGLSGAATAIGVPDGLPSAEAALANGTICHALDFDDTHSGAISHVSVAVVPAALAVAQERQCSGAQTLAAIVAGNEATIRIGKAAGSAFHARGFHPTAVCGAFGAALAVAKLRGLEQQQTVNALGIAGSMAAGLLEFLADGSATKRLHPGWAAHAGVIAARLAAHGATGPSTVFEGRFGVYKAFLGREDIDLSAELDDLLDRWETPIIAFKPYPACHYLHASLDATRQLMREERVEPEDIEEIVALTPPAGVALVLEPLAFKHRPRSEYEAKFSLPYSVASLIVRGEVNVSTYTDEAIADESVLDLAKRVRYEVKDFETAAVAFPGGVRLRTRDGVVREAQLPYQRGGPENPMTAAEVLDKFRANASLALDSQSLRRLESTVIGLEGEKDLDTLRLLGDARRQAAAG